MKKYTTFLTAILVGLSPLVGGELQAQESGAELWGRTCTRCHNGRAINERTDREWATIVSHMRARANLTRSDARSILEFLQATNTPAGGSASAYSESSAMGEILAMESDSDAAEAATVLDQARLEMLNEYLQRLTRAGTPGS